MNNVNNNQVYVDYPALYEEMRSLQGWNWWFKIHYPAILDLLKGYLKPGMLVLDLGSAGGWSTANLPAGVKRIILDLRPIALKLTEGKIFGRVCGDGHEIPLKTGACDLVVCEGLLHQCEAVEPAGSSRRWSEFVAPEGLSYRWNRPLTAFREPRSGLWRLPEIYHPVAYESLCRIAG